MAGAGRRRLPGGAARPAGLLAGRAAGRPPGVRGTELAADVLALLDELGLPSGRTWSGTTGAAGSPGGLAAAAPDRVRTLTAVSTPHPRALARSWSPARPLRSWYMGAFLLPAGAGAGAARLGRARMLRRMLRRSGLPREAADGYADRMRGAGRAHRRPELVPRLPYARGRRSARSTVPTLYVWGDRRRRSSARPPQPGTGRCVHRPVHVRAAAGHRALDPGAGAGARCCARYSIICVDTPAEPVRTARPPARAPGRRPRTRP